ncbi:MAG: patatin-like protein, partial [Sphingomonadaceae bacterium]|nr:patatin-like protein [Sphingomonadaceae bacterium]
MRQKELRIALVCYGGVSLAVYMHGVTKEIWKLARASRAFHAGEDRAEGSQGVYRDLLEHIESEHKLRLRVLPDILTGASAGGINAVFLAQAIHSGQSLEPLTDLWLDTADVDRLTDPDARPFSRFNKLWAMPLVWWLLRRPGNAVSDSVAKETRHEVRTKVSRLIRSRWFQPPFSGPGFSRLLSNALAAMASETMDAPLLPAGHPIDLLVTTTDFRGYLEMLRLNSPPVVEESEHRLPVDFHGITPPTGGQDLANLLELTLAARATASFPGAFPPLQLAEIDELAERNGMNWDSRRDFLERVMPVHVQEGTVETVSLIDGSVLVNAPFAGAMNALRGRPAQREVDRRFVYVDPRPDRYGSLREEDDRPVGFFSAIFGSLSTIPREQPIRDNLEALEQQSREAERLRL